MAKQDNHQLGYNMSGQNTHLVDTKEHESEDFGGNVGQEGICLVDMAHNQNIAHEDSPKYGNITSGDGAIQGCPTSGVAMNVTNAITGGTVVEESRSPRDDPVFSSTEDNIATSTTVPDLSSIKQHFTQSPASYQSPYTTVYDPTGHYASAYNRSFGGPQTEQEVNRPHNPPSSTPEGYRRFGSISQYNSPMAFATSTPSQRRHMSYASGSPFPENFRFTATSFERSQTPSKSHAHRPPSSEFEGLRRFSPSDIYTPVSKPVVIGRVVKQSGKRAYVQDDDEEYLGAGRGRNLSPLGRGNITYNNANHSRMESEYRGADRIQNTPEFNRFRVPGPDTGAKRRREVYMEDDDGVRDGNYIPNGYYREDSDSELFVSQNRPSNSHRPGHSTQQSSMYASTPRHNTDTRRVPEKYIFQRPESRPRPEPEKYFNAFGQRLEPSRYSGVPMPWGVASEPEMIDQTEVSDASLLKRNIARGLGKKICKRGYGASDPENIAIVNMKEFENLTFDEIARRLNDQRVREGKDPSLSAVGVNSRYNRTAPLLFSAQGKEFIPLSKRKGGRGKEVPSAHKDGVILWDDDLDIILVNCVKDVDAAKWTTVATLFHEKTGKKLSAAAAALRHNLL